MDDANEPNAAAGDDRFPQRDDPLRDDPDPSELCDACGTVITDETDGIFALVPDSSALHAIDPGLDGRRVLIACSLDHLAELVDEYRHRPYAVDELWAGKVCRALEENGGSLSLPAIAAASRLSEAQVERGVDWHNARARDWQRHFGDPPGTEPREG